MDPLFYTSKIIGATHFFLQSFDLQNPKFVKTKCQIISNGFFLNGSTYCDAMTNLISGFSSYKIRLSFKGGQ